MTIIPALITPLYINSGVPDDLWLPPSWEAAGPARERYHPFSWNGEQVVASVQ